jgi:uncharacterized integral membrane protein
MKRIFGFLVLLLALVFGLSFAAINSAPATIDFYFGNLVAPLSLVLVITIAVGALLGVAASIAVLLTQRIEISALKKRLNICETEVHNLREIPIREKR